MKPLPAPDRTFSISPKYSKCVFKVPNCSKILHSWFMKSTNYFLGYTHIVMAGHMPEGFEKSYPVGPTGFTHADYLKGMSDASRFLVACLPPYLAKMA